MGYSTSVCPHCGRNIHSIIYANPRKYHLALDGGNKYPDLLEFCGAGERLFILSETALDIFLKNQISGISGWEKVHVFSAKNMNKCLVDASAPQYYSVAINGLIDYDYAAMSLKKRKYCSTCRQYELNRQRFHPLKLDAKTWNNKDICSLETFPAMVVCTEKVKQLVCAHNLTGFLFQGTT